MASPLKRAPHFSPTEPSLRPPRRPYRPPIGFPARDDARTRSTLWSLAAHLFVIVLVLAPPFFAARKIDAVMEGAGGPGPAGGGGGGNRGTGGSENARERLQFLRVATPPPPPVAAPVPQPTPIPPVPKVEPPKPVPPPTPEPVPAAEVKTDSAAAKSLVPGSGGGSGTDGSAGSGPGSGGGVGSGVGTGRGSGNGPGTGGGDAVVYPPTVIQLAILPIPVPGKARPYHMQAYFDVDTLGNATLLSFNPSRDAGYNKRVREMLSEIRFRPAVRPDGRPVRDTALITAIAP